MYHIIYVGVMHSTFLVWGYSFYQNKQNSLVYLHKKLKGPRSFKTKLELGRKAAAFLFYHHSLGLNIFLQLRIEY